MAAKNKRLYNYLVNTLNISRGMVMEYVNLRIDDVLSNIDHDYIKSYCKRRVEEYIDDKILREVKWDISRKLEKEIEKRLNKVSVEGKIDLIFDPKIIVNIDMKKKKENLC